MLCTRTLRPRSQRTAFDGLSDASAESRQRRVERRAAVVNIHDENVVVESTTSPVGDLRKTALDRSSLGKRVKLPVLCKYCL